MKLIYFTSSYPFGLGEIWKTNELNEMRLHFDSITVVPYSYDGNRDNPKPLPAGVSLKEPLFEGNGAPTSRSDLFRILTHTNTASFLKEFFSKRVYRSKVRLLSWISATMNAIRLLQHPVIREIVSEADKNTCLTFFWGKGCCEFLPFIDTDRFAKVLVRMHRYDLFEDVNNGYIPYRAALLKNISMAAPSSTAGLIDLRKRYPQFAEKIRLFRLGSLISRNKPVPSNDDVLRIVSCSYLSAVKRVHLMVEALELLDFPVIWRHVGDGTLRPELEEKITAAGLEKKFFIEGMIGTGKLTQYYLANTFDVFVNVSASEGIPMSIMEVLSLGIPVIATNVGGNGEIVDDTVGRLLPADPTPAEIARALTEFYRLSAIQKNALRENAVRRCDEDWEVGKLTREVIAYLKS